MNVDEAKRIMRLVRDGAAQQELSDDKLALMAEHLSPLPFEFVERRVRRWMVSPNLDHRGHEQPKFVSDVDSFLDACGIPLGSRHDLVRAVEARRERHEMAELMYDPRALDELTYVGPDDPLPRGVAEHLALTGKPLPPGRKVDLALPAPKDAPIAPQRAGPPEDVTARFRDLVTQFKRGTEASIAVRERRESAIPLELQPAYDKLQAAIASATASKDYHAQSAQEYQQRVWEMVDGLAPVDMPIEVVRPAAVRLLRALVKHGGDVAAAEVLGELWGLQVTALETAPRDRFEDEPPQRVRVVLGQ